MSIAPHTQSTLIPNLAKTKGSLPTNTHSLPTNTSYLLGHRGARGEVVENSVAGFAHLQQLSKRHRNQLIGIEFDVQLTADSTLFVYHDDTLSRLHQRQSRLDQCTQQELLRPNIQQPHQFLFLEDMAPYLTDYQRIELEVKTHEHTNYQQLLTALQHALLDTRLSQLPITLTSFDITLHQHIQNNRALQHIPRGLLVEPKLSKLSKPKALASTSTVPVVTDITNLGIQTLMSTDAPLLDTALIATRLGCQGVGLYFGLFNPALLHPSTLLHPSSDQPSSILQAQQLSPTQLFAQTQHLAQQLMHSFQRYHLTTTAWTVNEAQQIQYLIGLGVNYIISDYPSKFVACF